MNTWYIAGTNHCLEHTAVRSRSDKGEKRQEGPSVKAGGSPRRSIMAATATPTQGSQARLPRSERAKEWLAASDLQLTPAESPQSPISPHDDAVGRLEGALAERDRRHHQYEAAF